MFTKRHWKLLCLGSISLGLAITLNLLGTLQDSSSGPKAIAMTDPPSAVHGARYSSSHYSPQLNDLLSLLPAAKVAPSKRPVQDSQPVSSEAVSSEADASNLVDKSTKLSIQPPSPPLLSTALPPRLSQAPVQGRPERLQIAQAASKASSKFGHLPYTEAKPSELQIAGYYGARPEQLHQDATQAYVQMVEAARGDGVRMIPISGFRTTAIQADLFAAQTTRQGSQARAARISAPPGHSEHHTGYAVDLGDEGHPSTDVEVTFEQTPAFQWLRHNASAYGFELSFPEGNAQGVTYEPWHWRYVGTLQARKVFAQAR